MTNPETYLYVGDHVEPLASGESLHPGQEPIAADRLDLDDPQDRRLVDEGLLIEPAVDEPLRGEALEQRAAELDVEGRGDMSAAQLRRAVAKAERDQAANPTPNEQEG